jgi:hypothetical protein
MATEKIVGLAPRRDAYAWNADGRLTDPGSGPLSQSGQPDRRLRNGEYFRQRGHALDAATHRFANGVTSFDPWPRQLHQTASSVK